MEENTRGTKRELPFFIDYFFSNAKIAFLNTITNGRKIIRKHIN